jgi:hypothetical protein
MLLRKTLGTFQVVFLMYDNRMLIVSCDAILPGKVLCESRRQNRSDIVNERSDELSDTLNVCLSQKSI